MNKSIWKFEFNIVDNITIEMPQGAEILTIQLQKGIPCMWAMVNTDNDKEERHFIIFGTGHPIPETLNLKYVGSIQVFGENLMFHVFEIN